MYYRLILILSCQDPGLDHAEALDHAGVKIMPRGWTMPKGWTMSRGWSMLSGFTTLEDWTMPVCWTMPRGWAITRGHPPLRCCVRRNPKSVGMAGLGSVWAMTGRRPKKYRHNVDAATRP